MQKQAEVIILAIVFVLGTISMANGQASNMIDNIDIVAIQSMYVKSNFLYIETEIRNANTGMVKLGTGKFTFYLRINKAEHEPLTKDERLGDYNISEEIYLKTAEKLANEDGRETNDVIFKVDLGKKQAFNKIKRVLNAIGNPSANNPVIYIHGKFYMGIQSDRGWSSTQASISWGFKPDLQERVLLEALRQPPPRKKIYEERLPFPNDEKGICKSIDKYGRALTIINFKLNSAKILPKSYEKLDLYGKILREGCYPDKAFTIEGHTCSIGTTAYNQKLSEERAKAVKKYLMDRHGISSDRLTEVGFGESYPRFSNKTERERAKNRRVEFVLEK